MQWIEAVRAPHRGIDDSLPFHFGGMLFASKRANGSGTSAVSPASAYTDRREPRRTEIAGRRSALTRGSLGILEGIEIQSER